MPPSSQAGAASSSQSKIRKATKNIAKREDLVRRKAFRKLAKLQDADRDDARLAAETAAEAVKQSWSGNHNFSLPESWATSYDAVVDDVNTIEGAMRLGLRLGLRDRGDSNNYNINRTSYDDASDFDHLTILTDDLTTAAASHRTNSERNRKKKKIQKNNKNKKNQKQKGKNGLEALAEELTQNAWMCGVCGKAFSLLEAADKHEEEHINTVVQQVGWAGENNPNSNFLATPAHHEHTPAAVANNWNTAIQGQLTASTSTSPIAERQLQPQQARDSQFLLQSRQSPPNDHTRVTFRDDTEINGYCHARSMNGGVYADDLFPVPMTPPSRQRNTGMMVDPLLGYEEEALLLPSTMQQAIVLADEALVTVCERAEPMILTKTEQEAELELSLLAKDKEYYDMIAERMMRRKSNPASRFRSEGKTVLSKVQNKFVDAYQLMKVGDPKGMSSDQYNRKRAGLDDTDHDILHSDSTLYVNVMVKNSISVVSHELERLAKQRWTDAQAAEGATSRFERFRALAHGNLVKLAGLALASDFTPRRIAVQLSNDLYRLLKPRMKRRGIDIDTEIEYRVGPYFVLAVNIGKIDWGKLIAATHKDVELRNSRWKAQQRQKATELEESGEAEKEQKQMGELQKRFTAICHYCGTKHLFQYLQSLRHVLRMTQFDIIAQILAFFYYFHWVIYFPICTLWYYTFLGSAIRTFIISSVTDEIFFYVEEKGMEMEIQIRKAPKQAAFMLAALRELRADDRAQKKKKMEAETSEKGTTLGPLLGPLIKQDKEAAVMPPDFEVPPNLEDVGLELDLPVGFRRLRWGLFSADSEFLKEAVFRSECKYDNITFGSWNKHDEHIGMVELPEGVTEADLLGAEKEMSYLMPKSAFVNANMCYETSKIEAYNDYCFCIKKRASTPDVPYGKSFRAWTQLLVINTGNNTCKLICSVEAEFPDGPPMVSRQIKSGMRAGTAEVFVKIGETISRYADETP